jgi:hypothetical protein
VGASAPTCASKVNSPILVRRAFGTMSAPKKEAIRNFGPGRGRLLPMRELAERQLSVPPARKLPSSYRPKVTEHPMSASPSSAAPLSRKAANHPKRSSDRGC